MPEPRGSAPKTDAPVIHVRLHRKDWLRAHRLAEAKTIPVSTWVRMVVMERLAREGK